MSLSEQEPLVLSDKAGHMIRYEQLDIGARSAMAEFYCNFEPLGAFQGLPPRNEEVRAVWIDTLLTQWINIGAFHQERLVGHSALDHVKPRGDSEYLVFVRPSYQNQGIGTALTRLAVGLALQNQCRLVWLVVQQSNLRAISVYRKAGFTFKPPMEEEREMILMLDRCET
jgi:ribosomal protein S18 acetylase RimI-like enzyme